MIPNRLDILVLDHTKLAESDAILTMLARDGSQVRGIAKGLRKSGSRFGAMLEPYTYASILLYPRKNLSMITEAKIVESNDSCRNDIDRSAAAAVISFVLVRLSQEGQTEPHLFDFSCASYRMVGHVTQDRLPMILSAFLFKVLAICGYRPILDSCCSCGKATFEPVLFSMSGGGVLCESCRAEATAIPVTAETLSWIQFFLCSTYDEIAAHEPIPTTQSVDLLHFAGTWASEHLSARIKPLDFFFSVFS